MNYADGQQVRLGDSVRFGADDVGIVVCSMDTAEYSAAYPETEWAYLGKRAMVDFTTYGLTYFEETDPELHLVARIHREG